MSDTENKDTPVADADAAIAPDANADQNPVELNEDEKQALESKIEDLELNILELEDENKSLKAALAKAGEKAKAKEKLKPVIKDGHALMRFKEGKKIFEVGEKYDGKNAKAHKKAGLVK